MKPEAMHFTSILELLAGHKVVAANLSPAPAASDLAPLGTSFALELGMSSFYIHRRPNLPSLTFNEEQAEGARLEGGRLTIKDAQGFMFDLDLIPAC